MNNNEESNSSGFAYTSFSQSGEDMIVRYAFKSLGVTRPSYLDIGAFHPFKISNTAYFYLNGSRGINVEPSKDKICLFQEHRDQDINLNVGVAAKSGELTYYSLSEPGLNTFSKESAVASVDLGYEVIAETTVPVVTIDTIIKKHANCVFPDFLNIDTEGLDLEILQSINYQESFPKVICAETLTFGGKRGKGRKITPLIDYLRSQGYMIFSDNHINTVFVKESLWKS